MSRFIFIIFLLFIGCQTTDEFSSFAIQSDVDTTVARIGDIINLSVIAENGGERIIVFSDIQETGSMEIRKKTILTKHNIPYQTNFQIVFWDTGSFTIPEYSVDILKPDSSIDLSIRMDSIDVKILSMIASAQDKNLRPIKGPVVLRKLTDWYRWFLILLLSILIIFFIGLWSRRIKSEPSQNIALSKKKSAQAIALERLEELKQLLNFNNKRFYFNASFIIREFVENQFYIRALEMTTAEIRRFEPDLNFGRKDFDNFIYLLNRADLAKFGKYEFTLQDRKGDFKWMQNLITNFHNT